MDKGPCPQTPHEVNSHTADTERAPFEQLLPSAQGGLVLEKEGSFKWEPEGTCYEGDDPHLQLWFSTPVVLEVRKPEQT